MEIRGEFGSFSEYIWGFTGGRSVVYLRHQAGKREDRNTLSDEISRDLKKTVNHFNRRIT